MFLRSKSMLRLEYYSIIEYFFLDKRNSCAKQEEFYMKLGFIRVFLVSPVFFVAKRLFIT